MPFVRTSLSNDAHRHIYIALGANEVYGGKTPFENLRSALIELESAEIEICGVSRPWRTPAWPDPTDPEFINGAVEVRTALTPHALMSRLHDIEAMFGRQRTARNAPRSLDLDLIDFQGLKLAPTGAGDALGLALPHPRATSRAFVLLPLRDIAPHWVDPVSALSIDQCIARLPDADRAACRPEQSDFALHTKP